MGLLLFANGVHLTGDRLPVGVHLGEHLLTGRREFIIPAFGAVRRAGLSRLDKALLAESAQDHVNRSLTQQQTLVFAEFLFDLVAVHPAAGNVVENRQLEEALTHLTRPVHEESRSHAAEPIPSPAACQYCLPAESSQWVVGVYSKHDAFWLAGGQDPNP